MTECMAETSRQRA